MNNFQMKHLYKKAKYIIRLDDACQNMNYEKWKKVEEILDRYNIKPIVAIIPKNKDKSFSYPAIKNFWDIAKKWKEKGWYIAQHGYDHVYISNNPGIIPINFRSEFAGIALSRQEKKILNGYQILKKHDLEPKIWVAPSHSFDKNTLIALKGKTNIKIISDGFFKWPCNDGYFKWIPQQLWSFKEQDNGVYTICLHPNEMEKKDFSRMEKFLQKNKNNFILIDDINFDKKCVKDMYFYFSILKLHLKKIILKILK